MGQQEVKTTKYEEIKLLKNRMIAHNTAVKRLDFFSLMDLITEIQNWLDYREWKVRRSLIYLDPKKLMDV